MYTGPVLFFFGHPVITKESGKVDQTSFASQDKHFLHNTELRSRLLIVNGGDPRARAS